MVGRGDKTYFQFFKFWTIFCLSNFGLFSLFQILDCSIHIKNEKNQILHFGSFLPLLLHSEVTKALVSAAELSGAQSARSFCLSASATGTQKLRDERDRERTQNILSSSANLRSFFRSKSSNFQGNRCTKFKYFS